LPRPGATGWLPGMPAPQGIDWAWATRTGGILSVRQKRQLLAPLLVELLRFPAARVRLATGRRGSGRIDLDALVWPDSALARDATQEARECLTPHVLGHSYRTWLFGLVLAQAGGVTVDPELTYVSSILHDLQLEHPTPGRCFAVVGGERAQRFALDHGAPADQADAIGAAVGGHLTPGAATDLRDPAGFVSAGALADLTGFGLHEMAADWVDDVHARHPRHDLRRHALVAIRNERKVVPGGRAEWLTRYASFPLLLRAAPFSE